MAPSWRVEAEPPTPQLGSWDAVWNGDFGATRRPATEPLTSETRAGGQTRDGRWSGCELTGVPGLPRELPGPQGTGRRAEPLQPHISRKPMGLSATWRRGDGHRDRARLAQRDSGPAKLVRVTCLYRDLLGPRPVRSAALLSSPQSPCPVQRPGDYGTLREARLLRTPWFGGVPP